MKDPYHCSPVTRKETTDINTERVGILGSSLSALIPQPPTDNCQVSQNSTLNTSLVYKAYRHAPDLKQSQTLQNLKISCK